MSKENIEVVEAANHAWNRGDMDAVRGLYDPDALIVTGLEGWPEPAPIVGRDAVMRQFEQQRAVWDSDRVEHVGDPIDVGDRVVQRVRWLATGRGPDLDMEMTNVYTVRNGRIFLVEFFLDHAEALQAVGLSKQDAHADP